jgi:hypothetical protein
MSYVSSTTRSLFILISELKIMREKEYKKKKVNNGKGKIRSDERGLTKKMKRVGRRTKIKRRKRREMGEE